MPETTAGTGVRKYPPSSRKMGRAESEDGGGSSRKNSGAWRKRGSLSTESSLILARTVALNLTRTPSSPQAAAPRPPVSSVFNAGRIFHRTISWWLIQRGPLFDHNKLCEALFFRVARVGRCPVAKERMMGVFFLGAAGVQRGPFSITLGT